VLLQDTDLAGQTRSTLSWKQGRILADEWIPPTPPYACETAHQYFKHFVYVQHGCGKHSEVDIYHPQPSPFHSTRDPEWPNLGPTWPVERYKRVHPHALETAYQYLKHNFILYWCKKQSEVDVSLNHDVIESFPLHKWQKKTKSVANLAGGMMKVLLYAFEPAYQHLKQFVHVLYGCEKQSEVNVSLNHHAMASFPLHKWPRIPKIWGQLGRWNEIRVQPYAFETAYQYFKHFIYV
jgi:hypothetical protein